MSGRLANMGARGQPEYDASRGPRQAAGNLVVRVVCRFIEIDPERFHVRRMRAGETDRIWARRQARRGATRGPTWSADGTAPGRGEKTLPDVIGKGTRGAPRKRAPKG